MAAAFRHWYGVIVVAALLGSLHSASAQDAVRGVAISQSRTQELRDGSGLSGQEKNSHPGNGAATTRSLSAGCPPGLARNGCSVLESLKSHSSSNNSSSNGSNTRNTSHSGITTCSTAEQSGKGNKELDWKSISQSSDSNNARSGAGQFGGGGSGTGSGGGSGAGSGTGSGAGDGNTGTGGGTGTSSPATTMQAFIDSFPEVRNVADSSFGGMMIHQPAGNGLSGRLMNPTSTFNLATITWPNIVPGGPTQLPTTAVAAASNVPEKISGDATGPVTATQMSAIATAAASFAATAPMLPDARLQSTKEELNCTTQQQADNCADIEKQQAGCAIDYLRTFLENFTVDPNNKWNKLRNELFLPMAYLLLLPGAIATQAKATVAQGFTIFGEVNPFEGLIRAICAIFLIPGTYLIVNYGIDLCNSIGYTINTEYTRIFGSDMYRDAMCSHLRAYGARLPDENLGYIPNKSAQMNTTSDTVRGKFEQSNVDVKLEDPCAGIYNAPADKANEMVPYAVNAQRAAYNAVGAGLATSWNILCAFQICYLYYLWFVGPIMAALWVYPVTQLRQAFPGWVEGVITLCFWSLFWQTVIALMACFRGIDDTGTVMMEALNFLATASVKYAFDFAGLVKDAGCQAAQKATSGGRSSNDKSNDSNGDTAKTKGKDPDKKPHPTRLDSEFAFAPARKFAFAPADEFAFGPAREFAFAPAREFAFAPAPEERSERFCPPPPFFIANAPTGPAPFAAYAALSHATTPEVIAALSHFTSSEILAALVNPSPAAFAALSLPAAPVPGNLQALISGESGSIFGEFGAGAPLATLLLAAELGLPPSAAQVPGVHIPAGLAGFAELATNMPQTKLLTPEAFSQLSSTQQNFLQQQFGQQAVQALQLGTASTAQQAIAALALQELALTEAAPAAGYVPRQELEPPTGRPPEPTQPHLPLDPANLSPRLAAPPPEPHQAPAYLELFPLQRHTTAQDPAGFVIPLAPPEVYRQLQFGPDSRVPDLTLPVPGQNLHRESVDSTAAEAVSSLPANGHPLVQQTSNASALNNQTDQIAQQTHAKYLDAIEQSKKTSQASNNQSELLRGIWAGLPDKNTNVFLKAQAESTENVPRTESDNKHISKRGLDEQIMYQNIRNKQRDIKPLSQAEIELMGKLSRVTSGEQSGTNLGVKSVKILIIGILAALMLCSSALAKDANNFNSSTGAKSNSKSIHNSSEKGSTNEESWFQQAPSKHKNEAEMSKSGSGGNSSALSTTKFAGLAATSGVTAAISAAGVSAMNTPLSQTQTPKSNFEAHSNNVCPNEWSNYQSDKRTEATSATTSPPGLPNGAPEGTSRKTFDDGVGMASNPVGIMHRKRALQDQAGIALQTALSIPEGGPRKVLSIVNGETVVSLTQPFKRRSVWTEARGARSTILSRSKLTAAPLDSDYAADAIAPNAKYSSHPLWPAVPITSNGTTAVMAIAFGEHFLSAATNPAANGLKAKADQQIKNMQSADNQGNCARQNCDYAFQSIVKPLINVANEDAAQPCSAKAAHKSDANVIWMVQQLYKQCYLPMAILLLLPGAVATQVKAIIAAGLLDVQDDDTANPIPGLVRSTLAIFLIPGTQLAVSYCIDIGNALTDPVAKQVQAEMSTIKNWVNEQAYASNPANQDNCIINTGSARAQGKLMGTPSSEVVQERQSDLTINIQNSLNTINAFLSQGLNVLNAFQLCLMCYLFLMGPIAAALYAWPAKVTGGSDNGLFNKVFGGWLDGVILLSLWKFWWCIILLAMAVRLEHGVDVTSQYEMYFYTAWITILTLVPFHPFDLKVRDIVSQLLQSAQGGLGTGSTGSRRRSTTGGPGRVLRNKH